MPRTIVPATALNLNTYRGLGKQSKKIAMILMRTEEDCKSVNLEGYLVIAKNSGNVRYRDARCGTDLQDRCNEMKKKLIDDIKRYHPEMDDSLIQLTQTSCEFEELDLKY